MKRDRKGKPRVVIPWRVVLISGTRVDKVRCPVHVIARLINQIKPDAISLDDYPVRRRFPVADGDSDIAIGRL